MALLNIEEWYYVTLCDMTGRNFGRRRRVKSAAEAQMLADEGNARLKEEECQIRKFFIEPADFPLGPTVRRPASKKWRGSDNRTNGR